ncbi:hypothetical protein [Rummeliibacillus sp. TYF-LIM-RU47]|uniref:hypothetical protein n=1 Tax=Rummeliibacillus sp. TYF-LIM-RU47 TaxID=2608406 RepID=UPI0012383E90|nr:hypothetical protein [Rummeliibacillus sp. TYF-LIM-RU47]
MKKSLLFSLALAGSILFASPHNIAEAATQPKEETNTVIQPYGAGTWDYLGTWTFSKSIRIQSGGGDLKVCAPNVSTKIKFGVDSYTTLEKHATTSGSGDNCAVFSVGLPGAYDIFMVGSNHPSSVTVKVYD